MIATTRDSGICWGLVLIMDKQTDIAVDDMETGMRQNSRLEIGGTDWVRTSDLALMKRPL